ncbi:uncharacterized protein BYT42DRAFT_616075 [Radiomyces spectabilis]|uniref:uncharacterized protein n=1 Tax=Radiomyces spectabilis TaxID=64574 RepID=UPI002220969D|nr:uncharacterized protein BYT42DRAFT_616075 [Radiomyces spectabilis]KAI8372873.1 hypothetical protein BYT42DRAFT_616075 [Radiomyces spectabilis]
MAFRFNWPEFDSEFYDEAKSQLEAALNKGNKPKNIVDHIAVKELHMGTQPPELEILEIGELSTDKFRGIFKLTYAGDAYIVLQTKVQANPMHSKQSDLPRHSRPNILAADQPLVVPMLLRISDLKLRGIVVLVVSKTKGITLVFKNDPLENILISSTFDSVTSVRNFLQREIEKQLRNLFQEDLPVMIHNLSLRHIQSEQEKAKKQQQEERLKAERLRQIERERRADHGTISPSSRSVFSDPGSHRRSAIYSHPPLPSTMLHSPTSYDTFSMPDLSPNLPASLRSQTLTPSVGEPVPSEGYGYPFIDQTSFLQCLPPGAPTTLYRPAHLSQMYTSFSDLYSRSESPTTVDGYFDSSLAQSFAHSSRSSIPMTTANLWTLNRFYSQPSMSQYGTTEYTPVGGMHGSSGWPAEAQFEDSQSEMDSYNGSPSSANSVAAAAETMYASDDADAPWYVTEGPELPSLRNHSQHLTMPLDQEVVIDPVENSVAAKLAQLTCINRTISPFAHHIDHFTYRSLPHTVKKIDAKPRHKKVPKRRFIRLNTSGSSVPSSAPSSAPSSVTPSVPPSVPTSS